MQYCSKRGMGCAKSPVPKPPGPTLRARLPALVTDLLDVGAPLADHSGGRHHREEEVTWHLRKAFDAADI